MSHRNLDYLHRNRVAYKMFPTSDKPTKTFTWGYFFENGTHQCYDLFRSKAKITSYKSLKWHMYVLFYINPHVSNTIMKKIIDYICNKDNGFITFTVKDNIKDSMISDVLASDLNEPPKNKLRKVIFKDSTGLSTKQKLKIVGELIGKSKIVNNDDIYECMLEINNSNRRITIANLARILGCSSRTIHRNMDKQLKKEKDILNIQNEEI